MLVTDRATVAEKAEAWDRMMRSTATNADDAVMEAWRWLRSVVELRERVEVAA